MREDIVAALRKAKEAAAVAAFEAYTAEFQRLLSAEGEEFLEACKSEGILTVGTALALSDHAHEAFLKEGEWLTYVKCTWEFTQNPEVLADKLVQYQSKVAAQL